ncbi:hypothetical protein ACFSX7_17550 [Camelimonas lactis]|uniref:hypothetical protein n=1 Tax=Camelimonas lactis TaxID=659006 RepID=UPI003642D31F
MSAKRPAPFRIWRFMRLAAPILALAALAPLATDLRAQGLLDAAGALQSGARSIAPQEAAPPVVPQERQAAPGQPSQSPPEQAAPSQPGGGGRAKPHVAGQAHGVWRPARRFAPAHPVVPAARLGDG